MEESEAGGVSTATEARLLRDIPLSLSGKTGRLLYVDTGEPGHHFVFYFATTALGSKALEDVPVSALRGLVNGTSIHRRVGSHADRWTAVSEAMGVRGTYRRLKDVTAYLDLLDGRDGPSPAPVRGFWNDRG